MAEFDRRSYIVRRPDLSIVRFNGTVPVVCAIGGQQNVDIMAPVGSFCKVTVVAFNVSAAPSAGGAPAPTVGEYDLWVGFTTNSGLTFGRYAFDAVASYAYGYWVGAPVVQHPPQAMQLEALRGVVFDGTYGLRLAFINTSLNQAVSGINLIYDLVIEKQVV